MTEASIRNISAQETIRRPLVSQDATVVGQTTTVKQYITLRKSIFFVILKFIAIELFFDLLFVSLRFPLMIFTLPQRLQGAISLSFIVLFVLFFMMKALFFMIIGLKWATCSYQITNDEIKDKCGLIYKKEKSFLYLYTQEVMVT